MAEFDNNSINIFCAYLFKDGNDREGLPRREPLSAEKYDIIFHNKILNEVKDSVSNKANNSSRIHA